jgi:hypothetical protein
VRRRLLQGGVVLAALLGVAAVVVLLPEAHRQPESFRNVPADTPPPTPKTVSTSQALRKELIGETTLFVQTAVRRHDLDSSWKLVHPNLKQGLSRKQWLTGAIPVVPFPAVGIAEWRVDWSYADDIAADVVLEPAPKSGLYRKTFTIEFKRVPAGHPDGRWLVYSWVPNGVSEALVDDEHEAAVQKALGNVKGHEGLPAWWVFVPIALFGAVIMLPVGLALNDRRRLRKAEEAHRAALAERYSSSSRPS